VSALSFQSAQGSPITVGTRPFPIAMADLDADGRLDLAVVNGDSDTITLLAGDGAGGFAPMSGSPIAVPRLPDSIVTGDFNRDGRLDMAVTSSYSNPSGPVSILLGTAGGFVNAPGSPFAAGYEPSSLVAGDFNLDGKADLVMAYSGNPYEAHWF